VEYFYSQLNHRAKTIVILGSDYIMTDKTYKAEILDLKTVIVDIFRHVKISLGISLRFHCQPILFLFFYINYH